MQYHLKDLTMPAKIGVYETEKKAAQDIVVNLWFEFDAQKAATTDALADTIDYAQIEALLREIALQTHVELLEKLHLQMLTAVEKKFPTITAVRLTLEKFPFKSGSIVVG